MLAPVFGNFIGKGKNDIAWTKRADAQGYKAHGTLAPVLGQDAFKRESAYNVNFRSSKSLRSPILAPTNSDLIKRGYDSRLPTLQLHSQMELRKVLLANGIDLNSINQQLLDKPFSEVVVDFMR